MMSCAPWVAAAIAEESYTDIVRLVTCDGDVGPPCVRAQLGSRLIMAARMRNAGSDSPLTAKKER